MLLALLFFFEGQKIVSFLLVSVDHKHSISQHKPSQKFNMWDFVASSQAFVAKAVIACDHWCLYIVKHRALLCVLLTHVWKPGLSSERSRYLLLCLLHYIHRVIQPADINSDMVYFSLLGLGLHLLAATIAEVNPTHVIQLCTDDSSYKNFEAFTIFALTSHDLFIPKHTLSKVR